MLALLLVAFRPSPAIGQSFDAPRLLAWLAQDGEQAKAFDLAQAKRAEPFFFMENEAIGKPAPDFTLPTAGGAKMSFAEFRSDKSAIVFFWATWCPHCRRELGNLNASKEAIEKKGIRIALVDIGEDEQTVQQYLQKNKIGLTVFLDQDSSVAESYNIIGVPTFYFVDKTGIVRDVQHSLPENYEEIFSEAISR